MVEVHLPHSTFFYWVFFWELFWQCTIFYFCFTFISNVLVSLQEIINCFHELFEFVTNLHVEITNEVNDIYIENNINT